MNEDAAAQIPWKTFLAASVVALPIVLFYALLAHFVLNVPFWDDYDALKYLNRSSQMPTLSAKLIYLIAAQQNEYKTIFSHAMFWLQHALFGTLDLRLTCALGNLFVFGIGFACWKMFLPREPNLARRLLLFLPATLLLFQLNFAETLNWAYPGLQNIPVVFFAITAIYLVVKPSWLAFSAACIMLMLAISASGNGFLLVPIGLLTLGVGRRYARIATWLAVTLLCFAAYAFHYNTMSSQSPLHHSILATILHMRPLYIFAFLGSAAYMFKVLSFPLGLALVLYLAYVVRRGYWRTNPAVAYSALFVLLTAIGVAGIRSEFGLMQALGSRYRIYCDLLMVLAWTSFAEVFIQPRGDQLRRNKPFVAVLAVSTFFCLIMDRSGSRFLRDRDVGMVRGMVLYEHPDPSEPAGPVLPPAAASPGFEDWNTLNRATLDQSIRLGIYQPPGY
jgi:hypothetical protein